jgi:Na+-driven multidrug efflux pump
MEKDMTSGSEWRVALFFTMPVIGSRLLRVLCGLADALTVANVSGPSALGAVSLT